MSTCEPFDNLLFYYVIAVKDNHFVTKNNVNPVRLIAYKQYFI